MTVDSETADLSVSDELGDFVLRNDGIGPAIDLKCRVTTSSGLRLQETTMEFLHKGEMLIKIAEPGAPVSPWPVAIRKRREFLTQREFSHEFWETQAGLPVGSTVSEFGLDFTV